MSPIKSANIQHLCRLVVGLLAIGHMAALALPVYAQDSPQEIAIPLTAQGEAVVLELRFVPAGKLPKEPPREVEQPAAAESDLLQAAGMFDVTPFYMSKTELTFQQLRAVLPAENVAAIRERILNISGRDDSTQFLRTAIDSKDFPAFAISLGEAVIACRQLTELVNRQQADASATIETFQFRLPSHLEWQYACRALSDPAAIRSLPHFNSWTDADALDKVTRAMLHEEWEKTGRNPADFKGTQFQVFDLIDARLGATDALGAPEKIMSAYFQTCLGRNRDFSKANALLTPVAHGRPNRWGLFDMHDNVCEWVLVANTREERAKLWDSIDNPDEQLKSTKCLLLVGGGFSQAASKKGAWKSFSIWGGYPSHPDTGDPMPMELTEGLDNTERGQAAEMNAGVRLVMDRAIRPDWFAIVRKAALEQDTASMAESVRRFRKTVAEVATRQNEPRLRAMIDVYDAIAQQRLSPTSAAETRLVDAIGALATVKPSSTTGGSRLSQLLGAANAARPANEAALEKTDDEAFFSAASQVFATLHNSN